MSNKLELCELEILKKIINAGIHCIPAITDSYFVVDTVVYSISVANVSTTELKYMKNEGYISWFSINCKKKMFDCKLTLKSWRLLH